MNMRQLFMRALLCKEVIHRQRTQSVGPLPGCRPLIRPERGGVGTCTVVPIVVNPGFSCLSSSPYLLRTPESCPLYSL